MHRSKGPRPSSALPQARLAEAEASEKALRKKVEAAQAAIGGEREKAKERAKQVKAETLRALEANTAGFDVQQKCAGRAECDSVGKVAATPFRRGARRLGLWESSVVRGVHGKRFE